MYLFFSHTEVSEIGCVCILIMNSTYYILYHITHSTMTFTHLIYI